MSRKRYYLTDSLFGTPDMEIPAPMYYFIVGSLWLMGLVALGLFVGLAATL